MEGIIKIVKSEVAVLSLKKYVPALLSCTQIYNITLCQRDEFSQLTESQC